MYYEEKIINGILHNRSSPQGEWVKCTLQRASAYIMELHEMIADLQQRLKEVTKDG